MFSSGAFVEKHNVALDVMSAPLEAGRKEVDEAFVESVTSRGENDYTCCDRCSLPFSTAHNVVRIIRNTHIRVDGALEDSDCRKLLGVLCESCADLALKGIQASVSHVNRVTVGASNPYLLMYLPDIIKSHAPLGPRHLELERLSDNTIHVTAVRGREVLIYVYHIDTKVLIPVPKQKGMNGEEGSEASS